MDVNSAAARLGVTPRRIRALIASGHIEAERDGNRWVIVDLGRTGIRKHRPLSQRSRDALIHTIRNRTLGPLKGQERARTAARLSTLRGADDPAALIAEWWGDGDVYGDVFARSLVERARGGDNAYIRQVVAPRRAEYLRKWEDLAQVLATERTVRKLSIDDIADKAGVPASQVRRIEQARPVNAPGALRRILGVVGVEPTALPDMDLTA